MSPLCFVADTFSHPNLLHWQKASYPDSADLWGGQSAVEETAELIRCSIHFYLITLVEVEKKGDKQFQQTRQLVTSSLAGAAEIQQFGRPAQNRSQQDIFKSFYDLIQSLVLSVAGLCIILHQIIKNTECWFPTSLVVQEANSDCRICLVYTGGTVSRQAPPTTNHGGSLDDHI